MTARSIPSPTLVAALLAPTLALASGCDFLAQLQARSGIVDVYATSHGSPDEQGNLPANNGEQIMFSNDMGWQVFLDEAYVTTAAVSLRSCAGDEYDVELYWGPLAEDVQVTADGVLDSLGGVRAESGDYCELRVEFAPVAEDMSNPEAAGSTVYLRGSAVKDDQLVEFVWKTEQVIEVEVDLREIEAGHPFRISREQSFAKKLSVSKDYCQFFMGVDFAQALEQADIDDLLAASLDEGTVAAPI